MRISPIDSKHESGSLGTWQCVWREVGGFGGVRAGGVIVQFAQRRVVVVVAFPS